MTNEEKVKYYDIASEKRIEFDRAMAKFNNKMVSNHSFSLLLSCLLFARLWNIQFIFCCLAGKWGSLTKLDILKALRIPHALVLERSFDRPNLKYEVIAKTKEPIKQLGQLLIDRFRNQCGIVYCLSKSECVELSKLLSEKCKIKTVYYHSGLSAHQRVAVKKKMRFVIHNTMSKSIESYYQESGRAGRDNFSSVCIALHQKKDFSRVVCMIRNGQGYKKESFKTAMAHIYVL
ncbi:ATP-dependent DNA helicase Q-like 1 isoform X4 [Glycine max]|uniref:ATP-dependent DNA helicase Q-like 1 isoform X4 n=1 Tax=Glycine max TaxID=3847 RepID=UPI0003DE959E|nr:ATP-dependent DNA helicase Q-like 1 isoform X4 [Glycine max]|eukprot:XP_025985347.1 ATP-dependent DNA helicase Q-like 1 isoform X4 [Glycine max]